MPRTIRARKKPAERRGSLLIDALLAIVIFGAVVGAFSTGVIEGQQGTVRGGNRVRATFLAEEGLEAVRSIRDKSDGFATEIANRDMSAPWGVQLAGSDWGIVAGSTMIDGFFTREIRFAAGSNNNQRIVTSTATWTEVNGQNRSVSLSTFITKWRDDPPPPGPDWTSPNRISSLINSAAIFEKVAISGNKAYVVGSLITSHGFYIYDITSLASPAPSSPTASIDINVSSYQAFDIAMNGNYAYVATTDPSQEIKIVDLTTETVAGNIPLAAGAMIAIAIEVYNDILYIGTQSLLPSPEFYAYNIAGANATSPVLLGSYGSIADFSANPVDFNDISIRDEGSALYAFVALKDVNTTAVADTIALDVTNPATISKTGWRDVPDTDNNLAISAVPDSFTEIFIGSDPATTYNINSMHVVTVSDPLPDPNNAAEGDQHSITGNTPYRVMYDVATDSKGNGFFATDKQTGAGAPLTWINHPFISMDFSDALNIAVLYEGTDTVTHILEGDMSTLEGGKGIASRDSDDAVFLVSSSPSLSTSHLSIIRPDYLPF